MGDSTCAQKDLSKNSPERGWGMLAADLALIQEKGMKAALATIL